MVMALLAMSFLLGGLGAWTVSIHGPKLGLVDFPNERSSHSHPVPKGGGMGIFAVFIIGAVLLQIPWFVWIPGGAVSILSLRADRCELSFRVRLAVQALSAAVFIVMSSSTPASFGLLEGPSVLIVPLGIFYICATANIYNFMDGIDGIAALSGVLAFSCLATIGLAEGRSHSWSLLALCIAMGCLGFLPLNFPKARVFMGDVGSILLGFAFSCLVIGLSRTIMEGLALASFLFPFYADEFNTFIVRMRDGDVLTRAHRRHIYQILANQAGIPHFYVTVLYGIVQIIVGISAWFVLKSGPVPFVALLVFSITLASIGAILIRRRWETGEIGTHSGA